MNDLEKPITLSERINPHRDNAKSFSTLYECKENYSSMPPLKQMYKHYNEKQKKFKIILCILAWK